MLGRRLRRNYVGQVCPRLPVQRRCGVQAAQEVRVCFGQGRPGCGHHIKRLTRAPRVAAHHHLRGAAEGRRGAAEDSRQLALDWLHVAAATLHE